MALRMSAAGRVLCSFCGSEVGVKTYSCPFKFCEQTAMCAGCSQKHPGIKNKVGHRAKGCEAGASAARSKQAERRRLEREGAYVLASCRYVGDGILHAIFRSGDTKIGKFITVSVYRQCSEAENATLEDCERLSGTKLPDAPGEFDAAELPDLLAVALASLNTTHAPPAASLPSEGGAQPTIF